MDSASVWSPGIRLVPLVNAQSTLIPQYFTSGDNQKIFNITNFQYVVNVGSVLVFINGVLQSTGLDYTETSSTRIDLIEGAQLGDLVVIMGFVGTIVTGSSGSSGVSTFNTRNGAVTLTSADIVTALGYTPSAGTSGVNTFNTRTGSVVLTSGDVTGALGFTPPQLSGTNSWSAVNTFSSSPQVPTASPGDSSLAAASTAFVTNAVGGAGTSNFVQAGTGALTRTMQNAVRDRFSVLDFANATAAVSALQGLAAGGGTIDVPSGITPALPTTYSNVAFDYMGPNVNAQVFNESGETVWKAHRLLRTQSNGAHVGTTRVSMVIEARPDGSTSAGPTNADAALILSLIKKNWKTTTTDGETDCLYVVVRGGGVGAGDTAGVLCDAGATIGNYITQWEGATAGTDSSGTVLKQIRNYLGTLIQPLGVYYGVLAKADVGDFRGSNLGCAFYAAEATGSYWQEAFVYGGQFGVLIKMARLATDNSGTLQLYNQAGTSKTFHVNGSGYLSLLNSAQNTELLTVDDSGNVLAHANLSAGGNIAAANFGAAAATYGTTFNSASGGSPSYTVLSAKYTKVGNIVYFGSYISVTAINGANGAILFGLPFQTTADAIGSASGITAGGGMLNGVFAASSVSLQFLTVTGTQPFVGSTGTYFMSGWYITP